MIALDTNLLVYAHREDSSWHRPALRVLRELAEGPRNWALPWPCVHEFLAIVTHPKIYAPPSTMAQAVAQVDAWLAAPGAVLLSEGVGHWATLRKVLEQAKMLGPRVHDARVAALCLQHGVTELWSLDRDFGRIPELKVRNPLVR
ncbi:MAG: PIN domain-containing protein [Planctomycetes bacterium]|nr:PIN domain-containing protein [Planctomycetota bacterium]